MKQSYILGCLAGAMLASGAAWASPSGSPLAKPSSAAMQTAQRPLQEGVDYELTEDRKGLAAWMAEDLATVDFTADPVLAQLEYIDVRAFFMRSSVEHVVLPETLTTIGEMAFCYSALKEITLPQKLEHLGEIDGVTANPFAGCSSLKSISVAEGNKRFKAQDGVLFMAGNTLVAYPLGSDKTSYTIPEGVQYLGQSCFSGAFSLQEVVCPSSLYRISALAFEDVETLSKITLNEGLEYIEWGAFKRTAIESLTLPKSLRMLEDGADYENPFVGMEHLKSISLAEGTTFLQIKDKALYLAEEPVLIALPAQSGHTSFALGGETTAIAVGAFAYHRTLESFSALHHMRIPLRAFDSCAKLRTVELKTGTPFIGTQAFSDCVQLTALTIGVPFVPTLEDEDAFDAVPKGSFVLHIPKGHSAAEYNKDAVWHAALEGATVAEDATAAQCIVLHRGGYASLGAGAQGAAFHSSCPVVAPRTDDGTQIFGNVVGVTSIVLGDGAEPRLFLAKVEPKHTGLLTPWLNRYDRTRRSIEEYEHNVAHRVVVKEEDNFGAKMVTFADEKAPGVAVAYMFFDDEAAEYVTWTFDSKSLYEKSKVGDFLAERYAPATGKDIDDESFDGFVGPDGVGYEYRELSVSEEVEPVVSIAFFISQESTFKANPLPTVPVVATEVAALRFDGGRLHFPEGVQSLSVYSLDGTLVLREGVLGSTSCSLEALPKGIYLAVADRPNAACLVLKLIR